ncbi:hypothetical protein DDZ14_12400 [Maritimibacter sp. 55A14]|nr:hypothetical protein DDZ14_12400 [Maritimibacter sp. 55A14]
MAGSALALSGCVPTDSYARADPYYYPDPSYRYFYYPSSNVYYNEISGYYYYLDGSRWRRDRRLPRHYRLNRAERRFLRYRGDRPFDHNRDHRRGFFDDDDRRHDRRRREEELRRRDRQREIEQRRRDRRRDEEAERRREADERRRRDELESRRRDEERRRREAEERRRRDDDRRRDDRRSEPVYRGGQGSDRSGRITGLGKSGEGSIPDPNYYENERNRRFGY